MLEEEADLMDADLAMTAAAEPSQPKRQRTEHAGEADALDDTMTQFMSTDVDPALLPQEDSTVAEGSILEQVQETRDVIREFAHVETWSEQFRHIMEGALAVHRLRLLDLSRREEVLFVELIEGRGLHVRAHDSQRFFYSEHGRWSAYNGVIPQRTLARCKAFLIQLERLCSMFGNNVLRENQGILMQHKNYYNSTEDDWMCSLRLVRKLPYVAQTSLLNDSLIKYYVEWCSIDACQQGGFCTMDGCFVFEPSGRMAAVPKSPRTNVYVHLPRRMLDALSDDVKDRVHMFWQTTYWGNAPAFDVCMASLTLALRGRTWIGQSLQTAHLEGILGTYQSYHSCLDMNIYFMDE
ncbi:unnamed protein product, partial [Symbiodinium sp. CCMP2456]